MPARLDSKTKEASDYITMVSSAPVL